jgi:predicted metal-dependent hydrolase
MGVSPKEVQIREMKRKWASCSSKGRLSFSKDLLDQDPEFVKEVVIH